VLNDFVVGTSAVYTDASYNEFLASASQFAMQVVVDQVTGTGPTITVAFEHSADGRNWVTKNASGSDLGPTALSAAATNTLFCSDAGTIPFLGFIRIRVSLGGTGALVAHVKIHLTGRDKE
jgi:hypothetical protein